MEHAHMDPDSGRYEADRFYRMVEYEEVEAIRLQKEWDAWIDECYSLIYEATKAANWFAEVVRRDINPLFFAADGKFIIVEGPLSPDLSFSAWVPQYKAKQKAGLPDKFLAKVRARDRKRKKHLGT